MCLKPRDLATYQKIVEKMSRFILLSSEDIKFLNENGLQQKYTSYMVMRKIKNDLDELEKFAEKETERIKRSIVSS
jgi:deferrochelatase/peroxidase EfeB